jgi:methylated-DNA-[protein]-cysteine S-methyltransferase
MSTNPSIEKAAAAWLAGEQAGSQTDPLLDALDALYAAPPPPEAIARARAALAGGIDEAAPLEIDYDLLPGTSLGDIWLAVGPQGLVALDFGVSERDFVAQVRRQFRRQERVAVRRSSSRTAGAADQLRGYLAGQRMAFDLPVDLSSTTAFQRQVLQAAVGVPRGQVVTYGEIARRIGKPAASRAVGQALGSNPVPIVVPCHRVIGADGSLRGYSGGGGLSAKAKLLELEGASLPGALAS